MAAGTTLFQFWGTSWLTTATFQMINLIPVRYSLRFGFLLTHTTCAKVGAAGEISLTGRRTLSTISFWIRCLVLKHIPPLLIFTKNPRKGLPDINQSPFGKAPTSKVIALRRVTRCRSRFSLLSVRLTTEALSGGRKEIFFEVIFTWKKP